MFTRKHLIKRDRAMRIEVLPLVDIVFILLIFLAVTSTVKMAETGIKLKLPKAATSDPQQKGIAVVIGKDQRLYLNGQPVTEDGLYKKIIATDHKTPVALMADEATPYHRVVAVLDTIRLAGATNVVLQVTPKQTPHVITH